MQIIRNLIAALDRHTEAMNRHTEALEEHAIQMDELGFELNCADLPFTAERILESLKGKPETSNGGPVPMPQA